MIEHDRGLPDLEVKALTKEYAQLHAARLAIIASNIPGIEWDEGMVLTEAVQLPSGDQLEFLGKWGHSVALALAADTPENQEPVALAMGYEATNKDGIPTSLHLSALARDPDPRYKGAGERTLRAFLQKGLGDQFAHIGGDEFCFSLQTGAGDDNEAVRNLYENYGFKVVGTFEKGGQQNVAMKGASEDVAGALLRRDHENNRH